MLGMKCTNVKYLQTRTTPTFYSGGWIESSAECSKDSQRVEDIWAAA